MNCRTQKGQKSGTIRLASDEFNISRIEKPKEGGNGHLKRFETAT